MKIFSGVVYAAEASAQEFVNFMNEDRTFSCEGSKVEWFAPTGLHIPENKSKFEIETREHDASLTIKNVNAFDMGEYRCVSEAEFKQFNLKIYCELINDACLSLNKTILDPLTIENATKTLSVKESKDATLKCKAIGIPSAQLKWYFGNGEIGKLHNILHFLHARPLLPVAVESSFIEVHPDEITLKMVQREQSGTYTCVAYQELAQLRNYQQRDIELIVECKTTFHYH